MPDNRIKITVRIIFKGFSPLLVAWK